MNIDWLHRWSLFKIDALGLVTLFGADEFNRTVGRLCFSRATEFLLLVAGYVIANDNIKVPITGFTVYNLTDGICADDVTGWVYCWILCQDFTYNATTLMISVLKPPATARRPLGTAACLGAVVCSSMMQFAVLTLD